MSEISALFSDSVDTYDSNAMVQAATFRRLLGFLGDVPVKSVLDLGCGTGTNTRLLVQRYPDAAVTGVDFAPAMIETAVRRYGGKSLRFLLRDLRSLDLSASYDLIVSNATFQWIDDLRALAQLIRKHLNPDGRICLAIYGPRTFYELKQTLSIAYGKPVVISASQFRGTDDIRHCFEAVFPNLQLRQEMIRKDYGSLHALLSAIKQTGTRGRLSVNHLWTPGWLRQVEGIYGSLYPGITASYQVFYLQNYH